MRPNVLFIMADQLSRPMLSCYGNPVVRTPNIQKLSDCGITLDANYVQNPICSPSRCSIFTGRYPSVCGTRTNGIPLRESERTLPQCLVDAGYRTFAAGKLHFRHQLNSMSQSDGSHAEFEGTRPYYGFQKYALSDDNRIGPYTRWINREYPEHLDAILGKRKQILGNTHDCWAADYPVEIHQTNWIADQTIQFIENQDEMQPWMAFCSFADPHHPFNPPEPYASMYNDCELPARHYRQGERESYPRLWRDILEQPDFYGRYSETDWDIVRRLAYGMVTLIDDALGRVFATLEACGQIENTLIIFTSDHGEMLGDHGLLYKGTYHFDNIIRTPLIWKWPEAQDAGNGRTISALTQSLDIMPSILEACGLPVPDQVQGKSMLPLLRNKTNEGRPWVLTENYHAQKLGRNWNDWCWQDVNTIVTPDWKFTLRSDRDTGQLFDRINDPCELYNLWDDSAYRSVKSELSESLCCAISESREHPWRQECMW